MITCMMPKFFSPSRRFSRMYFSISVISTVSRKKLLEVFRVTMI